MGLTKAKKYLWDPRTMRTIQPLCRSAWKKQQIEKPRMLSSVIRVLDDCLRWAVTVAVLVLAGCASIPNVPTQNILMFSGDGKPIDPTGNLNCMEPAAGQWTPCHDTEKASGGFSHGSLLGYPELSDTYYETAYLGNLFDCMREYFRAMPALNDQSRSACKQEPRLEPLKPVPKKKKIMIFVHGGLNTQVETIQRVADLYNRIAREGYYPIFINWRASFTSSYLEQLVWVRQGEKQRLLGLATAPTTFAVDVARSIARAPLVWIAQRANDIKTLPFPKFLESKDSDAVAKELICAYEYHAYRDKCLKDFSFRKSPVCLPLNVRPVDGNRNFGKSGPPDKTQISISVGEDLRTCAEMDVSFLMYFLTLPSRLLFEPAVDAFGTSAWDNLLRESRLLYNVDDEFTNNAAELARQNVHAARGDGLANIPRSGGTSIFLKRLSQVINNDAHEWEITLVGHSMGTIIINQMLRESIQLKLKLPIKNIVYMAAAASVRDVQDSILPYLRENLNLQKNEKAQFYNLMLHPIAEEREPYNLGPLPYPFSFDPGPRGSLLVIIDNILSKPLTYLDRTAGRYENFILAAHDIPFELRRQVHIKVFSAGDSKKVRSENPQRHSEFTKRFKFWIENCWKPDPEMDKTKKADCVYD